MNAEQLKADAFAHAVAVVLRHEGGLISNPADPGGITNYGISIRFSGSIGLDINGDGVTTGADIIAMKPDQAATIYRAEFWDKCRCSEMPPPLALCVLDTAVNMGQGVATILLQRALGAKADGIIGSKTIGAANRPGGLDQIVLDYMARRAKRYAADANVETFGRGWYRRLLDVYLEATGLLADMMAIVLLAVFLGGCTAPTPPPIIFNLDRVFIQIHVQGNNVEVED